MKKKNRILSEELNYEPRDGSELKPELEKEAEKHNKEVEKDLDAAKKVVDKINDSEPEKLVLKDGSGKDIKGLTEDLNEDVDDDYSENFVQAVDEVHNILASFISKNKTYMEENGIDLVSECDDLCDQALTHIEEAIENGFLEESFLTEKIPSDLAKAYKKNKRTVQNYNNIDFENADYTEISPEEAKKKFKEEPWSIKLLIDGNLVDFRDNGYHSIENRVYVTDRDKMYVKKNGDVVNDTARMPIKHLFDIADKIYYTNERTATRDPQLLQTRADNKPRINDTRNLVGDRERGTLDPNSYYSSRLTSISDRYITNKKDMNYKQKKLAVLKDRLAGIPNDDSHSWDRSRLEDQISNIEASLRNSKDMNARIRYADSENSLRAPFRRYKELKNSISNQKYTVERLKDRLEDVKNSGDPEVKEERLNLENLKRKLYNIQREIAISEMKLDGSDEQDLEAIKKAEASYNSAQSTLDEIQNELNRLLRRS